VWLLFNSGGPLANAEHSLCSRRMLVLIRSILAKWATLGLTSLRSSLGFVFRIPRYQNTSSHPSDPRPTSPCQKGNFQSPASHPSPVVVMS
jgi:hypothetical protein